MTKRVLVQVNDVTHAAWKERAFVEGRSMSDLARALIEGSVLTERGVPVPPTDSGNPVREVVVGPPRSASAESVQPMVHDEGMINTYAAASRMALRDGKCGADVAFGTKCKLCGKVH